MFKDEKKLTGFARGLDVAYFLLTPFCLSVICYGLYRQNGRELVGFLTSGDGLLFWCVLLVGLLLVYGIVRLRWLALLLTGLFPVGVTLVSYFKTVINGEPLQLSDFGLIGNAGDVAGFALDRMRLSLPMVLLLLLYLAMILLGAFLDRKLGRISIRWGGATFGSATVVLALLVGQVITPVTLAGISEYTTQMERNIQYGVPMGLMHQLIAAQAMLRGDGTDLEQELLAQMQQDLAEQTVEETLPHIIYVMNESFFDITRLPNITFSEDPLKNYHKLTGETQTGRFYTVTVGGGTGWVEMETFMGVPSQMISTVTANTQLTKEQYETLPSYVRVLQENGYDTIAFHAHTNELYNREQNFPLIGFDEVYFYESFQENATYNGLYFDDASCVDVITSLFEEHRDNPTYIYTMTMQNHQPYYEGRYEEHPVTVESDRLTAEELQVLQCYVTGLYYADQMLGELVDYFSQVEEPVILAFSGDHTGSMFLSETESVYSKLSYVSTGDIAQWTAEDFARMYSTNYCLWSNDGRMEPGDKPIGTAMMGAVLLDAAHVKNTPYYAWVARTGATLFAHSHGNIKIECDGELVEELNENAQSFLKNQQDFIRDILYGDKYLSDALLIQS